ncbi:unnamed protein product [Peronospora destructor]|uniref:BZIP domain-containing protein n=1 Tax=Peronospora destructor TaxID=86335 RepID=A0AAV0TRT4_9STRA|nr:unnamed protein product [Peronospora destructor]
MPIEKAVVALAYFSPIANPMNSNNKLHADTSPESTSIPYSDPFEMKPRRGRRRLLHDEEQRKARRKAQCKLNQRRYRARQRGLISTLSHVTEGMNGHLEKLQDYRDFLRDYFLQPLTVWNDERPILVTKHFFQTFRAGFALQSTETSSLQESFIRLVCAPGLVAQGATTDGIEALLLQLKRYTSYHGNLEMRPQNITVIHVPKQQEDDCVEEKLIWVVQARGKSAEDVTTVLEGAMISQFSELGLDPQDTAAESALTRGCKQLSLKYILL